MTIYRWLYALFLLSISRFAFAVAGGAGGGGGGGGGYSSGGGSSSWGGGGFSSYGGDSGDGGSAVLVIWIIVILSFIFIRPLANSKNRNRASRLYKISPQDALLKKLKKLPTAFYQRNPNFSQDELITKVTGAFIAIQKAWVAQDMSAVRRWVSDGIWQRFHTQFVMMQLMGQKNIVSNIQIDHIYLTRCEQDGAFDIIDVAIHFTANDDFISTSFPSLSQRGRIEMIEYWSFIRKSGVKEGDMYSNNRCPSCGSDLPDDMGEIARCPSCHAISNLGDYDWVLSEITQADDYANASQKLKKIHRFQEQVRSKLHNDKNFCFQLMEDKASNAYMQIMTARVSRNFNYMHRFTEDTFFEQLSQQLSKEKPFVFNRLYFNDVSVINYYRQQGVDHMVVRITRSAQRVDISRRQLKLIDPQVETNNEIMILSRKADVQTSPNSVYAFTCPSCGAPLGETTDLICHYCHAVINNMQHEWVVTALMPHTRYIELKKELPPKAKTNQTRELESQIDYTASDYALNNLLLFFMQDNHLRLEEKALAHQLAKKLGYDAKKLTTLFKLAENRQLSLRLPMERKKAKEVRAIMSQYFFSTKGKLNPQEQAILMKIHAWIEKLPAK